MKGAWSTGNSIKKILCRKTTYVNTNIGKSIKNWGKGKKIEGKVREM
jgi:hypothetical protein